MDILSFQAKKLEEDMFKKIIFLKNTESDKKISINYWEFEK
jgi:hypothetical protein